MPAETSELDASSDCHQKVGDGGHLAVHVKNLADRITRMECTRPEIQRSTRAANVLWCLGQILRQGPTRKCLYNLSEVAEVLDEFWSHSWRERAWRKVLALLVLKNGPAAAVIGTLAAIAAAVFKGSGFLPGYTKPSIDHIGEHHYYEFSLWALGSGVIAAAVTLVFWQSQTAVFLDKVCINQVDDDMKAEGILSIGGFLRSSKSLLVLWDPTYVRRLWCIFEYAAFVKSHEGQDPAVVKIRPTFLGPCTLWIFFGSVVVMTTELTIHTFLDKLALFAFTGLGVVGFYFGTAAFRNYYDNVRQLQVELADFKLSQTKCLCCDMGHEEEGILCDRQVVMECVHRWFGSVENFDKVVSTDVSAGLTSQLGQYSFPYRWLLGATTPILWAQMDMVAARFKAGDNHGGVVASILALAMWLVAFPSIFVCWVCLASMLRKGKWMILDMLQTLTATVITVALAAGMHFYQLLCNHLLHEDHLSGVLLFAGTFLVAALLAWHPCAMCRWARGVGKGEQPAVAS
ncbi:cpr6 [Symbiodinium natans]|uniref:Cpr6 protein n=1 Tax=Symbiodinium natans TaxID=878477 RepID=A0A812II12_9DINO|nr:cpr6 [Symbiodinium natans]